MRSRTLTWTQIETKTAFQLSSSELILKPRLLTTQVLMMNQKRKFSFPLCRILFLIRWWIRWYTQCLIAQGHGLLRRTMQPSLLEGHSSKQHIMQLALWPKYFTWGFSQIPNFLQCYSHSIMQIGGLFRVSIFDWPKRQIQIEKINVDFLVRGIFISEMINLAGFILSERFPRTWNWASLKCILWRVIIGHRATSLIYLIFFKLGNHFK